MTRSGQKRVVLGRYRLLEDLGARRLGRLFSARDEESGAGVAVLELNEVLDRRAVVERARVAAGNAHPNVVTVIDARAGAVVFDALDGRDARAVMKALGRAKQLPLAVCAHIASSAAAALAWSHARGVAHGTLWLDDVFILSDASVKVLGVFCGSPTPLAAPVFGEPARDDIRALGEVLFRLITNTSPYASVVTSRVGADGKRRDVVDDGKLSAQAELALLAMPRALGDICKGALKREIAAADLELALASLATSLPGADVVNETLFSLARRSSPAQTTRVEKAHRVATSAFESGLPGSLFHTSSPSASSQTPSSSHVAATPSSHVAATTSLPGTAATSLPGTAAGAPSSHAPATRQAGSAGGKPPPHLMKAFPPPLRAAAQHRAERADVTQRLVDDDVNELAELVEQFRHAPVWWIEEGESGRSRGAVTLDEIHRRAQGGRVTARSLVWCSGMTRWRELRHLDVAAGLLLFAEFSLRGSPVTEDSLPNTIWDYEIVRRLGDGGQGVVYLARDATNGYDVALKSIPLDTEGARARFEREVRAVIGTQGHPHITQLHRWRIDRGQRRGYLAFSYIPGKSLAEIIAEEGRSGLDLDRCVALAEHIALGLAKLHERDFIHRDLKPQNVMVRNDPGHETAVLIDLGIAKLLNVSSTSTNMGSPLYAAPERFRAAAAVDHRSDLYSLGLILFEMLTGRAAFPAGDLLELAIAHTQKAPPDPGALRDDVPAALAALTLRLLAKDPADRPDSAMVVVERLREARRTRWTARAKPKRPRVISAVFRFLGGGPSRSS